MSSPGLIPPTNTTAPPPPPRYTVFRGPNGIRAGWRVLIFWAIGGAIFFICAVIIALFVRGRHFELSQLTPLGTFLSEGSVLFLTVVSALIMARIERRKFGDYGLPLRHAFQKNFWIGSLTGFLAISVCLLAIYALHGFQITGLSIHGSTIVLATAAWSGAFAVVGMAEEFAFRGYVQYTLTTGMGFWPSAILLSALFALAHSRNPGESTGGLLSIVVFALVFCLLLRRTGNLWLAVGFHAGWDWGQTFFYGVPDSGLMPYHNLLNSTFSGPRWLTGGTVGPEASVFTPIVLLLVAVIFSRIYRQNQYPASGLGPQRPPFGP